MTSPFAWIDLLTTDPAAAAAFYAAVCGWTVEEAPGLRTLRSPAGAVGAVQRLRGDAAPHWLGMLPVADVVAACRRVQFLRGAVLLEPSDLGGMGSTALVADPDGAVLHLWQPAPGVAPARSGGAPGSLVGAALWTSRPDPAATWYRAALGAVTEDDGWTFPGGGLATVHDAGADPPLPPQWMPCLAVADVDAACRAAVDAGGHMLAPAAHGLALLQDPQGAGFGVRVSGAPGSAAQLSPGADR